MRVSLCALRPGQTLARAPMRHLPWHTDKGPQPLAGFASPEEVATAEQAAKNAWAALKGAWVQRSGAGARDAGVPASTGTHAHTQAGTNTAGSSAGSRSDGLQALAAAAAATAGQAKPAPVKATAKKPAAASKPSKPPPAKPQQLAPAGQPSLFGGQFGFTRSVEHRGQLQELPPVQPFVGHLPCPEPTCAERFDRLTALRSHVRHKHSGLPLPPLGRAKESAAGEGASSGDEGDPDLTSEDEGACC